MAPQLQINQGPQDALLFDNTRSYFTNVGYVRTSNFQMELRDVDPQNAPSFGSTVNFVIPKAADLLGPVDLMIEFNKASNTPLTSAATAGEFVTWGWVETLGYAMIEKLTFSVGPHDIEVLTGEELNIMNELMKSDSSRFDSKLILKTGRPLTFDEYQATVTGSGTYDENRVNRYAALDTSSNNDRIIAQNQTAFEGKKLIIPLGLFFTLHPSKYFPLAAIAGCNDIRVAVKLRPLKELLMKQATATSITNGIIGGAASPTEDATVHAGDTALGSITWTNNSPIKTGACKLRCHYIHVTGPEATALMNREHVRLMKMWSGNHTPYNKSITCTTGTGTAQTVAIDLSFLHPVTELIITIRRVSEMNNETDEASLPVYSVESGKAGVKSLFAYHGSGVDPNVDSPANRIQEDISKLLKTGPTVKVNSLKLLLNGQSRHLDGQGIDRQYLMDRLMPMLHSNTSTTFADIADTSYSGGSAISSGLTGNTGAQLFANEVGGARDFEALAQKMDRKEIFVFPFALNPEGANPSGSVNFSKVSHARLELNVNGISDVAKTEEFHFDVYGVYYNWLAIKDGRALLSFA